MSQENEQSGPPQQAQQNGLSYEEIAQTIGKLYLSLERAEQAADTRYRDIIGALQEQSKTLIVENSNLRAQLNPEEKSDEEKQ